MRNMSSNSELFLINSKNASELIGTRKVSGFLAKNNIDFFINSYVWYAGGIKEVEDSHNITNPRQISLDIYKHERGINFDTSGGMSLFIKDSEISTITFENSEVASKQRWGAIGKGIVGGALFGPAGLVLGAIKGHSDTTKDANTSLFVNFNFTKGEQKYSFVIEVGPKAKNKFLGFVDHNYRKLLSKNTQSKKSSEPIDIPKEIEKYFKLKESGVISEQEFEIKKKELLES